MSLKSNGFYEPDFYVKLTADELRKIYYCCPAIHVESNVNQDYVWGKFKILKEAWASDEVIRKKASSGGIISAISIYLLETKQVDAILQIGVSTSSSILNEMKLSYSKQEILANCGSRYAPALMFNKLREKFDSNNDIFAFIGKPCDISALKNFIHCYPEYKRRILFFISLFCAGMPSYNATKELLKLSGCDDEPYYLKYRGDGWPGDFLAKYRNNSEFRMSYDDSWGGFLGKNLGLRCKICPDGIGLLADIAVADSWNIKDNKPSFEESDGRSFVIIRTSFGKKIFDQSVESKYIIEKEIDIKNIRYIQKYQYERRLFAGYRAAVIQLFTLGILRYKKLGLMKLALKAPLLSGIRNFGGTLKRFIKK
jgi:coenzyme F420 hydrogenase subunit beta